MTCSHWGAGHEVAGAVPLILDSEDKWEGNLNKEHSLSSLQLWDPNETQERTRDPTSDKQSLPEDVVCSVSSLDMSIPPEGITVWAPAVNAGLRVGLLLQVSTLSICIPMTGP